ncbi:extra-cytoplasmic solute receptor [Alicycliphilus sp. B1]|nr:extra-cytoplasmic solute receptor [Alicycliphilus sp. B1]
MADPAVRARLVDVGLTPAWGPGSVVTERVERELPQMRAVAARSGHSRGLAHGHADPAA